MVFVFLLGAICTRESLRYDFMIAEKVPLKFKITQSIIEMVHIVLFKAGFEAQGI